MVYKKIYIMIKWDLFCYVRKLVKYYINRLEKEKNDIIINWCGKSI